MKHKECDVYSKYDIIDEPVKIGTAGKYTVYIKCLDSCKTPHFHIVREGQPDICLKIETAEYFYHGDNAGTLSSDDLRLLMDLLAGNMFGKITNWVFMLIVWNDNNPVKVFEHMPITDYTKLEVHEEG